jgi:tetratricopeptide (TPR) repeat protein
VLFVPGRRLLLEKIPFLALAVALSVTTFLVQKSGGAVAYVVQFPLGHRVGNAFLSYGAYLGKTAWPAKLAVFYPYYWADVPWWQPALGAALVAGGGVAAVLLLRRRPVWFVGWAWYLGTLLPVIGIIQVGSQSMADRYTYLPQIGVLLPIAWGLGELAASRSRARAALMAAAPLVLAALAAATWVQATRWQTSVTLFSHAVRVTKNNFVAYAHLGYALVDQGRVAEGGELIARSFRVLPASRATAFEGAGDFYASLGMEREAAEQYGKALAIEPSKRHVREKLRALGDLAKAPAAAPPPDPHRGQGTLDPYEQGNLLVRSGRREDAVAAYREAIRAAPGNYEAWHNLGCVLGELGRTEEAIAAIEETLRLRPDHPLAGKNLEAIRAGTGQRGD